MKKNSYLPIKKQELWKMHHSHNSFISNLQAVPACLVCWSASSLKPVFPCRCTHQHDQNRDQIRNGNNNLGRKPYTLQRDWNCLCIAKHQTGKCSLYRMPISHHNRRRNPFPAEMPSVNIDAPPMVKKAPPNPLNTPPARIAAHWYNTAFTPTVCAATFLMPTPLNRSPKEVLYRNT